MSVVRVSAREAHELVCERGYVYLDVRAVPEFDTGHPPGAYNVPLLSPRAGGGMDENAQFLDEVRAALPADAKLVVGCASGVRSQRASALLLEAGFRDVVEQRAGIDGVRDPFGRVREKGHRAEGLPLATRAEPGRSHAEIRAAARAGGADRGR
ncbi:MAG TPA: rhodanese-like domain-containing protein [Polyangiales bacterium]